VLYPLLDGDECWWPAGRRHLSFGELGGGTGGDLLLIPNGRWLLPTGQGAPPVCRDIRLRWRCWGCRTP